MDKALIPPQVAKLLKVSPETVLNWIRSGQLKAYNVANLNSRRPRYRIDPGAVEQFKRLRQVIPPPPKAPRSKQHNDIIQFY